MIIKPINNIGKCLKYKTNEAKYSIKVHLNDIFVNKLFIYLATPVMHLDETLSTLIL